jgi:hypothetical protein
MNKRFILSVFILLFSLNLLSVELGLIGGKMSNPSEFNYGLSGGFGLFIPFLKMELEFGPLSESELNVLTAALKIRHKFGKLAPFAAVGVGTQFEKLGFDFDQYEFFTSIGGGVHLYFASLFSVRVDIRFQNFSDRNRIRFGAGIFFHL